MARTKRKPYTGSKAVDASCRSHGSCPWCKEGRKAKVERQKPVEMTNTTEFKPMEAEANE